MSCLEGPCHTNDSQIAQEQREIWIDGKCSRCSEEKVYNDFVVQCMDGGASKAQTLAYFQGCLQIH